MISSRQQFNIEMKLLKGKYFRECGKSTYYLLAYSNKYNFKPRFYSKYGFIYRVQVHFQDVGWIEVAISTDRQDAFSIVEYYRSVAGVRQTDVGGGLRIKKV